MKKEISLVYKLYFKESLRENDMKYAPVLIETCNRSIHLIELLESLENNTHAKLTEIYISVDFPPSSKYIDGNKKVIEYLKLKEHNNNFKKIKIFYQSFNRGPAGNLDFLVDMVRKDGYDRFIITEDDNVFAPAFLDFCNKGLELSESNPRIMNVCGHRDTRIKNVKSKLYFQISFSYGSAYLLSRYEFLRKQIHIDFFERFMCNPQKMFKLSRRSRSSFECLVWGLIVNHEKCFYYNDDIAMIDNVLGVYSWDNNFVSLNPTYNLVSNRGYDGSGVNCTSESNRVEFPLFTGKEYDFLGGIDYPKQTLNKRMSWPKKKQYYYFVYRYVMWLICDRKLI